MAGSKLNLGVVLTLSKEAFDKGLQSAVSSINKMRYQFAGAVSAIAAGGLTIANVFNKIKDTAIGVERSRLALKNISQSTEDFNRSQQFLLKTADKYGQNIVNITREYAKFKASADQAGVSVSDQEKIFASLSRTIATFGLDANDANLSFLALTQMMSKGKISSEELRRQLGERIPIAYAAMVKATGKTTAEFESMLKSGKVLSAEVLPKFADELNKMTVNANFDQVFTSWERLTNLFREGVRSLDLPNKVKPMLDSLYRLFKGTFENIGAVIGGLGGLLASKLIKPTVGWFGSLKDVAAKAEAKVAEIKDKIASIDAQRSQLGDDKNRAVNSLLKEQRKLYDSLNASEQAVGKKVERRLALENRLTNLKRLQLRDESKLANTQSGSYERLLASYNRRAERIRAIEAQITDNERQQNEIRLASTEKKAAIEASIAKRQAELETAINKSAEAEKRLEDERTTLHSQLQAQKRYAEELKSANMTKRAWIVATNGIKMAWSTVKSFMMTSIYGVMFAAMGALIGKITDAISKAREANKEAMRMANSLNDYNAKMSVAGKDNAEYNNLKHHVNTLGRIGTSQEERARSRAYAVEALGLPSNSSDAAIQSAWKSKSEEMTASDRRKVAESELSTYREKYESLTKGWDKIKDSTHPTGKLLYNRTRQVLDANNIADIDRLIESMRNGRSDKELYRDNFVQALAAKRNMFRAEDDMHKYSGIEAKSRQDVTDYGQLSEAVEKEYISAKEELAKQLESGAISQKTYNDKLVNASEKFATEYGGILGSGAKKSSLFGDALDIISRLGGKSAPVKDEKLSPIEEARKSYAEALKRNENQLSAGIITGREYLKAKADASKEYAATASALLGERVKGDEAFKKAREIIANYNDKLTKAMDEFDAESKALATKLSDGIITEGEYAQELTNLVRSVSDRVYSGGEVQEAERAYVEDLNRMRVEMAKGRYTTPTSYSSSSVGIGSDTKEDIDAVKSSDRVSIIKKSLSDLQKDKKSLEKTIAEILEQGKKAGFTGSELDSLLSQLKNGVVDEKRLAEFVDFFGETLIEQLTGLIRDSRTIDDAINIGEKRKGIQENRDRVSKNAYNGIKDVAKSADRLKDSMEGIEKLISSPDASGWEKLVGVFNALAQAVDAFITIGKGINAIIEFIETYTRASETASAVSTAVAAKEVASSTAVTTAKATETAAKATAAHAGIPFAGIAIAGAAVAGLIAIIRGVSAQKFANGGIVSGHSYTGDRVPALLNSGEMVLNSSQQARLFQMANGKGGGGNGTVVVGGSIRARGSDLEVVLKKDKERKQRQ